MRVSRPRNPLTDQQVFVVSERHSGRRIDVVIREEIPELSRQRVQSLLSDSMVTVNGRTVVKPSTLVRAGDQIAVCLPLPVPSKVEPENLPLDILFEDEHVAVVNKPPGQVVHPVGSLRTGTLVNALLHHFGSLSAIGGVTRPGIVHRLDKEASGVLIVAKTDRAHRSLSEQFKNRCVEKLYWALVHGVPRDRSGKVDLPIGRHPRHRNRFAVRADGRAAVTAWRYLGHLGDVAWLEISTQTGRTHQIRVHLRYLGHPILKDCLYGFRGSRLCGWWADRLGDYPGILLHACRVGFTHPVSGDIMRLEVDPPTGFLEAVAKVRESQLYAGDNLAGPHP